MARRLILALLASGALAATHAGDDPAPATRVEVAGDAITFRGRIERRAVERFIEALRDPGIRRLVITSPGGQVASALDMAEAIAARGLDLEVPLKCRSSCANYVFPAARHKRLGHARAVGWHGNMLHVLYLDQVGRGQWSEEEMQAARWLAGREAEFFRRIGVDGFVCWFAKIAPYDIADDYTMAPADMARFGIRDVEVGPGASPLVPEDTPEWVNVEFDRVERDRPAVRVPLSSDP